MIDPSKKTIEQILNTSTNTFSVPKYQRSFNWGMDELRDLIQDLEDTQNSDGKDLFLGNFIFDVSNSQEFQIVDGQQRLTTISLILIAIREHAKKINENMLASQIQEFISTGKIWSQVSGNKIKVSENIRDLFEYMANLDWKGDFPEKIEYKQIKRQVLKIKPIYTYIMEIFSSFNKDELNKFTKVLFGAYVIVIQVQSQEDVFSIFERTNARGLDLNIADLLKNMIFSNSIDLYEDKWDKIIKNADGSLQRMLKYFWISREGYISASGLYKSLKSYANRGDIGITKFVDELYDFSYYYKIVQSLDINDINNWLENEGFYTLSKNEDYYISITRVFRALKLFNVTQPYPLIFSLFYAYKNSGQKSFKNLINCLQTIENYHFVNNVISGKIGNKVEKLYAETAKKLYQGKEDYIILIEKFILELKSKKSEREDFKSNFISSVIYSKSNYGLINYIFDKINNYGAKGGQIVEIYSPQKEDEKRNFNIEHFLPQSFKNKYIDEGIDVDFFDYIGNLIPISRHTNSSLQDKNPIEKVQVLMSDPKWIGNLSYPSKFLKENIDKFENWGIEEIRNQTNKIAEDSYNVYWNF